MPHNKPDVHFRHNISLEKNAGYRESERRVPAVFKRSPPQSASACNGVAGEGQNELGLKACARRRNPAVGR
jgi:hypothetical protein